MRRVSFALLTVAALGCGGSPPPAPPAPVGPQTWAELAPHPPAAASKQPGEKRYQIIATGALPEVETLEASLAKQGLVADVGDEKDGRVVESQGVRCSVQPGPKLGDDVLPSPKIEPEYTRHGLTQAQAEQLAASTVTAEVSCREIGRAHV